MRVQCFLQSDHPRGPGVTIAIDVDQIQAPGQADALAPALRIYFEAESAGVLLSLEGWLRQASSSGAGGIRIPSQAVSRNHNYLDVPLDDRRIQALEAFRKGGPLHLSLELAGIASLPHPDSSEWCPQVVRMQPGVYGSMQIGRERWRELLLGFGWKGFRLVELPERELPQGQKWQECLRLLEQARVQFETNQMEACLENCRKIVEGVVDVLLARWGISRRKGRPVMDHAKELGGRLATAWPSDEEAGLLLADLYRAAWYWTSPSHHYGSRMPLYREAAFALELTANLLCFGGHLLEAHPEPLPKTKRHATSTDASGSANPPEAIQKPRSTSGPDEGHLQ